jgi:hypothetical protein
MTATIRGLALVLAMSGRVSPATAQTLATNGSASIFPPYLQNPAADGMTICFLAQAAEAVRVAWSVDADASLGEVAANGTVIPGTPWTMWKTRLAGLRPGGSISIKCPTGSTSVVGLPKYLYTTSGP